MVTSRSGCNAGSCWDQERGRISKMKLKDFFHPARLPIIRREGWAIRQPPVADAKNDASLMRGHVLNAMSTLVSSRSTTGGNGHPLSAVARIQLSSYSLVKGSRRRQNYPNRLGTRGRTMNRDDAEIANYLRFLLEHQERCHLEQCTSCLTLQGMFQQIRARLFSGPIHAKAAVAATAAQSR
jgi:hypothetical protein